MTKLIINADDYGYCEGVNYGIISAHKNGIVTSYTMMANMPGFEHGIQLLKETPTLKCRVHMTLTCYKPVLDTHKTIVAENRAFYKKPTEELFKKINLDEVYKEFCAQVDKVRNKIDITHLDSHHHVHGMSPLREVTKAVADLMCHPAFIDSFLNKSTTYLDYRLKEHEVLTSSILKELLLENGIELSNYSIVK